MEGSVMAHAVAVIGAAISAVGGSIGIGMVGGRALDAMARQPEESKNIRTNMILVAALIEGLSFFSIIVALIVIFANA